MKPFLDPFPFRNPEARSDLAAVIAEITTEKTPAPIPPSKAGTRYDKYGDKFAKKSVPTKANPTTPRVSEPLKTESVVAESHSRAALERLSTTELRELKKKYEAGVLKGDRKASEALATVRGLLRSKGGGHALDEAATPCERAALARLKSANTADLQDKPGAAGERAHARLHKTIGKVLKSK
jgi:hypothetical protein